MADGPVGSAPDRWGTADLRVAGVLLVLGVLLTPLLAAAPTVGVVISGGALLVLLTVLWPVGVLVASIALTPLLAGLDRGAIVPHLRLNEVLILPVVGGLALVVAQRFLRSGRVAAARLHPLDAAVVAVAVTGSVSTLLWMYARGRDPSTDDLLYAMTLWKLVVLYIAVRLFLRDGRTVRQALCAIMLSAGLIGIIGVLQAVGVGPVIDVLAALLPPGEGGYSLSENRATSTLGNPIAYGDLMLYAGISAAALALRLPGRASLLWSAAAALALFALASGQASIAVGLVVAVSVFALATGTVGRATVIAAGFSAVALTALQPVVAARLDSRDPATGLPTSWTGDDGRLENLQEYFWPHITADYNWLFGVQTAGRVPGRESWREWVFIESGYAWALWTGGLLMLLAVLGLLWVTARTGYRLSGSGAATAGAMGTTLTTVAGMLSALLVFDPHLTFRGAGEVLFVLLAVGANLESYGPREGLLDVTSPLGSGRDGRARARPVGASARGGNEPRGVPPTRSMRAEDGVHLDRGRRSHDHRAPAPGPAT